MLARCFGLLARPSGEFAPAGDLLFERPKSRQKVAPRSARPFGLPCAAQALRARAKLPSLRSGQTVARSQKLKRAAHAPSSPCAARRAPGGTEGTAATAGMRRLAVGCFGCSAVVGPPLLNRREAQQPRARAQRASTSDFVRLSERSVAKRVPHEPWVASIAGNPDRGGFAGAPSLPTFLCAQESRSPAGANSRHGPRHQHPSTNKQPAPHAAEQPQ
jgi:hypothetical protein